MTTSTHSCHSGSLIIMERLKCFVSSSTSENDNYVRVWTRHILDVPCALAISCTYHRARAFPWKWKTRSFNFSRFTASRQRLTWNYFDTGIIIDLCKLLRIRDAKIETLQIVCCYTRIRERRAARTYTFIMHLKNGLTLALTKGFVNS